MTDTEQFVRTGLCTCCEPPRPATQTGGPREEWMHDDDEFYAEMRHVHVHTHSSDCDGPMEHWHTYRIPNIREEALRPEYLRGPHYTGPEFSDLWDYLCKNEVSTCYPGTVTISPGEGNDDAECHWSYTTDEGHRGGEMEVCSDPECAHEGSSQRDHYAEAMGY
jgi:hypothetical protein